MTRNTIISRNAVVTPEGETVTVCVRRNVAVAGGAVRYCVFIDGGMLANGSDLSWYDNVRGAMQRAADEAYSVIIGM
jgi:hypothetical protein